VKNKFKIGDEVFIIRENKKLNRWCYYMDKYLNTQGFVDDKDEDDLSLSIRFSDDNYWYYHPSELMHKLEYLRTKKFKKIFNG